MDSGRRGMQGLGVHFGKKLSTPLCRPPDTVGGWGAYQRGQAALKPFSRMTRFQAGVRFRVAAEGKEPPCYKAATGSGLAPWPV